MKKRIIDTMIATLRSLSIPSRDSSAQSNPPDLFCSVCFSEEHNEANCPTIARDSQDSDVQSEADNEEERERREERSSESERETDRESRSRYRSTKRRSNRDREKREGLLEYGGDSHIHYPPPPPLQKGSSVSHKQISKIQKLAALINQGGSTNENVIDLLQDVNSFCTPLTPSLNIAEYRLLLISLVPNDKKRLVTEALSKNATSPDDMNRTLVTLYGENKGRTEVQEMFFQFTPYKSKNKSVVSIVSQLYRLGNRGGFSNEQIFERVLKCVPNDGKIRLMQLNKRTATPVEIIDHLSLLQPHLDNRINTIYSNNPTRNRDNREQRVHQVKDSKKKSEKEKDEKENKKEGGVYCFICLKRGHLWRSCWHKNTHKCVLCGGVHPAPLCEVYKNTLPVLEECGICKKAGEKSGAYTPLFHPEENCLEKN